MKARTHNDRCRGAAAGEPLPGSRCHESAHPQTTAAGEPLPGSRCRGAAAGEPLPGSRCRGAAAGEPLPGSRCRGAAAGEPLPGSRCRGAAAGEPLPGSRCRGRLDATAFIDELRADLDQALGRLSGALRQEHRGAACGSPTRKGEACDPRVPKLLPAEPAEEPARVQRSSDSSAEDSGHRHTGPRAASPMQRNMK